MLKKLFAVTTAVYLLVGVPIAGAATCEPSAARKAEIANWLALFATYENAYNNLAKTIARAGSAPTNYISPNVSPGIAQGPNIPDMLDGQTILRKDLYFAHDETAKARQACRDLNCGSYTLPSTHTGAQSALNAFKTAAEALPKFAGPSGMMLTGSAQRFMSNNDADALRQELVPKTCSQSESDARTTTTTTTTTSTTPVTPPVTSTGTYSLEYVTGLLKQIQTLTNENAQLKSQLAAARSQTQSAQTSSAPASSASATVSAGATASSGACPVFTRSLSQGATGFDVSTLQEFLAKDPAVYPEGLVTAYFGPATERAVQRWQANKGVANAGVAGFGTVGPRTQAAISAACI